MQSKGKGWKESNGFAKREDEVGTSQKHRVMEWFGLEGKLNPIQFLLNNILSNI